MTNYYFVDTNIIISYLNQENQLITNFIDDPKNVFCYTETVQNELFKKITSNDIPTTFKFISSRLTERKKELALIELTKDAVFHLNDNQKKKFRNDIFIIFESGFCCYDEEVADSNDFTEPMLLTNNLKLYRKFIKEPVHAKRLEDIINLYGLEHLIRVVTPSDIIVGL